jgi:transposase
MDYFAGLNVSVKDTSVCIVDDTGKTIREVKVASEPEALLAVLNTPAYHFKRIGLEAGPLSQWLFSALAEASLPVIRVEQSLKAAVNTPPKPFKSMTPKRAKAQRKRKKTNE